MAKKPKRNEEKIKEMQKEMREGKPSGKYLFVELNEEGSTKIDIEKHEDMTEKKPFVSTNRPRPPKKKSKILTTRDLDSEGKTAEQRFWDKEKTMKKPALVTGDVALSESEEGDKKRAEVMAEIKKKKEKK